MRGAGWTVAATLVATTLTASGATGQAGGARPPQVPRPAAPGGLDVKTGVDAWERGDYRAAVEAWRAPAVAGDADAQFNLGQAYKLGRGVPLDPVLAESWFRKAALQRHPQAEDNYGLALFQSGKRADALPWLEKGVARGEPRTQLVLGTMLFNGDAVPRDYPRAYALMTLASQKGLKSAGETLAQMDRYITAEDRARGVELARQYAAQARVAAVEGAPSRTLARADATPRFAGQRPSEPPPIAPDPSPRAFAAGRSPAPAAIAKAPPTPRPAPPAPKPAPLAPKPATVPPAARGGAWRVQLGAFRDRGNAEALWKRVGGKVGGQPAYVAAAGVTRLQATGFATRADATRACSASGVSCVVVAP